MSSFFPSVIESNKTTDGQGAPPHRRKRLKWGIIAGFWLFFGLLNASQLYLGLRMENFPVPVGRMFSAEVLAWGAWAFLTPLVLWLGRRFPLCKLSLCLSVSPSIMLTQCSLNCKPL